MDELQQYVQALDIASPSVAISAPSTSSVRAALASDPAQPAGYVNSGSLVSFVAGIEQGYQDDVLNSTLLAQLHADTVVNRLSDPLGWYVAYTQVLGKVGWVIQNFNFQRLTTSKSTITLSNVIVQLLGALLSENAAAIVSATMDALQALPNGNNQLSLFNSQSASGSNGNFQLGAVSEIGGAVAMTLGAFYFTANQIETQFLWFEYESADMNFSYAQQTVTLDEAVYSRVRQSVIDKLGSKAVEFIADLDI